MTMFAYEAQTAGGRLMRGTLEAASPDQAREQLEKMDLEVSSLERAAARPPSTTLGRNELLLFNQQLAAIAKAGLPLSDGLRQLSTDIRSRKFRRLAEGLADDLEEGMDVQEAFERRRKHFPPLYGRIVAAGVRTGRLSEMLLSLNRHLEASERNRRIIIEALAYPAVVVSLALVLTTVILLFIVPAFREMFTDLGVVMPLMTRALFVAGEHLGVIWICLFAVVIAAALLIRLGGRNESLRRVGQRVKLRLPVFGSLYRLSVLARLTDALGLAISAGCDLPEAFRLAGDASGSEMARGEGEHIAGGLEEGAGLVEAGEGCSLLSRLPLYAVQLGMQRDELLDNIYGLAESYSLQAQFSRHKTQALLGPILLIFVGGIIGLIVTGLFSPAVSLVSSMGAG